MIKYSIIIPHKNIPQLLQRCLDSIADCEEIQVIVVDDNSDSNIVDFAKFPGLDRTYTEVYFTKDGRGAGYARNEGLKHVKGKWTLFADADDYFTLDLCSELNKYYDSNYDVVYFYAISRSFDSDTHIDRFEDFRKLLDDYLEEPSADNTLKLKVYNCVPWAKMLKTENIQRQEARFDEVRWANDVMFNLRANFSASNIFVSKMVIYCVTMRKDSLTQKHSLQEYLCRIKISIKFNNYLYDRGFHERIENKYYIVDALRLKKLSFFYILFLSLSSRDKMAQMKALMGSLNFLVRLYQLLCKKPKH